MPAVDPSIFREYDIRGVYPTQLDEETFYIIGRTIASYLKVEQIAVGRDMRISSPSLFKSLTNGVIDQGTSVVDLGLISTEMNYFASGKYQFPANVIVSASHNPKEYNGLKIVTKNATPLHGGNGLPEIKNLALKNEFFTIEKKGTIKKQSLIDGWIDHVLRFIDIKGIRRLKIVIDAGNGMGGVTWQKLRSKLPVAIIPLYFEPDGNFPHHLPDPLRKENLVDLKNEILKQNADLGFAIDGDADRLFVVDEAGNQLSGTITTAILASYLLAKFGPSPVLYNAVCGKIVPETIKKYGGNPIRVRVGHSFIKEEMKKNKALFAGEHSGHFYFRDNFYADSSTIAGLIFLEFLSQQNAKLSRIVAGFNKYYQSGEINFKVKDSDEIMRSIENHFPDAQSIDYIDGLSVWYKDWWFNLRASKTEPLLRLNLEADNRQILLQKLKQLENAIIEQGEKNLIHDRS